MTTENEQEKTIECGGLFTENGDTEHCVLCGEPRDTHEDEHEDAGALQGHGEIIVEGAGRLSIDRTID